MKRRRAGWTGPIPQDGKGPGVGFLLPWPQADRIRFLVLVLVVLVAFFPAVQADFVWDDFHYILAEPAIREPSGIWTIWFAPEELREFHYWPLTYTTFWLEHKLWDFRASAFHLANLILHLANSVLVWRLLRHLAIPAPWLIALVFSLHPVHVETAVWIIERKDLLAGLFYLAAMDLWFRFTTDGRPSRYVASLMLFVCGMLSKTVVVTFPAALLVIQWWRNGTVTLRDLSVSAPYLVIGAAIALFDLHSYDDGTTFALSPLERMLVAAQSIWFYAAKLAWPVDLAVIYPYWDVSPTSMAGWSSLLAGIAVVAALWFLRHRTGRGPLAGVAYFVLTLSPTLGFLDFGYMHYSFVADRYQYLASIGLIAVVVGGAGHASWKPEAPRRQQIGAVVTGAAMLVLGLLTWRQATIWQNGETLYRHVLALNPEARHAHCSLGIALHTQERLEEALEMARIGAERSKDEPLCHLNLGRILVKQGREEESGVHLRRAIELDPEILDDLIEEGTLPPDFSLSAPTFPPGTPAASGSPSGTGQASPVRPDGT